jgi:hypothetical protein
MGHFTLKLSDTLSFAPSKVFTKVNGKNVAGLAIGCKSFDLGQIVNATEKGDSMKQVVVMFTMLVCSLPQAFAVVADHLVCKVEMNDWSTRRSVKQTLDFYIARLPEVNPQYPDAQYTSASVSQHVEMARPTGRSYVSLNIGYRHAFKKDSVGKIDAREQACNHVSASWCDNGSACATSVMACPRSDPFDPTHGWPKVGVAPDGTPLFDESQLPSMVTEIQDGSGKARGSAIVNCQFKGTYQ